MICNHMRYNDEKNSKIFVPKIFLPAASPRVMFFDRENLGQEVFFPVKKRPVPGYPVFF